MGSVDHWYDDTSQKMGYKIEPEWDNPEYFLKNVDKISEEKIKEYKDKQVVENVEK